jgi:hypothetical protein
MLVGCAVGVEAAPDVGEQADELSEDEPGASTCYCTGSYACGHSKSASYMFTDARTALATAGVPESDLTQTYGDAAASVGTHCPEPGKTYSAATDIRQSSNPCGRVHELRMQGFAAWFRTAPEFPGNLHIHAVYAGAPGLKDSLKKQVASFLQGRNGLKSDAIDTHCPITVDEKDAVSAASGIADSAL